jgi:hypothetical protein
MHLCFWMGRSCRYSSTFCRLLATFCITSYTIAKIVTECCCMHCCYWHNCIMLWSESTDRQWPFHSMTDYWLAPSVVGTDPGLCWNVSGSCVWGWSGLCGPVQSQEPWHTKNFGLWPKASLGKPWCPGILQEVPQETVPDGDSSTWQTQSPTAAAARTCS